VRLLAILLAATATVLAAGAPARAADVAVPVVLDFAFLREALVTQLYTEPGERAAIWDDGTGCGALDLFEPAVDAASDRVHLRIRSRGAARVALPVGRQCLFSVAWTGVVEVLVTPEMNAATQSLTFRVVDSNLYDADGRKSVLDARLWDLVKARVHPRMAAVRIDLERPVAELRTLLPLVLPGAERPLATLAMRDARVVERGVAVTMAFTVDARPVPPPQPEPPLSPEELAAWQESWERLDAFLTFVVKQVGGHVAGELRRAVADVLIDGRHDLVEALAPAHPDAPDPVPALFLRTWERLAPVVREAAPRLPAPTAIRYVSFIAAGDALAALAQLGPEVDLDISADGLRRLARTVAPESREDPVDYGLEVDPDLRLLLDLGPPLPPPELPPDAGTLRWWPVRSAWAAVGPETVARLNQWLPTRDDLDEYLPLVRDLLLDAAARSQPAPEHGVARLFRDLVLAAAWQESCWRQFVSRGGKRTPITSSVGSVGLMQINWRVWRGLYDVRGVQWDIAYNARAGSEILRHYLVEYALARGEHRQPGGFGNLVRSTYAMYNGGPTHRTRYRSAKPRRSLKRIDDAFWQKYQKVGAGRELEVAACWG